MTPTTTYTTLQLARQIVSSLKELHYIGHGYGTIIHNSPVLDAERDEVLRQIVRDALDNARTQYEQARRRYAEGRERSTSMQNHLFNLEQIALDYAWK